MPELLYRELLRTIRKKMYPRVCVQQQLLLATTSSYGTTTIYDEYEYTYREKNKREIG